MGFIYQEDETDVYLLQVMVVPNQESQLMAYEGPMKNLVYGLFKPRFMGK